MLPDELPLTPDEIKLLMRSAGYNQSSFANRLGVTRAAVSRWTTGVSRPSAEHLAALRAIGPRPGKGKEWVAYLAHVDSVLAANRPPRAPLEAAAPQIEQRSGSEQTSSQDLAQRSATQELNLENLEEVVRRVAAEVVAQMPKREEMVRQAVAEAVAQQSQLEAVAKQAAAEAVAQQPSPEQMVRQVVEAVVAQQPNPEDLVRQAAAALLETQADERGVFLQEMRGKLNAQTDRIETLTSKTEERFDILGGKVEATSAELEGRLDGALGALGLLKDKVEVVSSETQEALGAIGDKVEGASSETKEALGALGDRVEAASASTSGQLAELAGNVGGVVGKLDQAEQTLQLVHAQQGRMDQRVRTLGQALWGLTCVAALGLAALVLGAWQGSVVNLFALKGAVPGVHGEMGEAKTGKPMPEHPLSSQARVPCDVGELAFFGGCWIKVADQAPPCLPRFYFYNNACYLPVVRSE